VTDSASVDAWQFATTHLVRLSGIVDFAASVRLRLVLFEQLDAGCQEIAIDLAEVRLLDASAIGVMLSVREQLIHRGGTLQVQGARDIVLDVLEVTGAAKTLGAYAPPFEPPDCPADDPAHVGTDRRHRQGGWGDEVNNLLWTVSQLPAGDTRRKRLRDQIVETCLPYAERLAHRFHGLGESAADLRQVAALGLLKAVDRFDPSHTTDFASYATPTIVGELKRHFRDRGWSVRAPRRLQELRLDINQAREALVHQLGGSPTAADVAHHLDVDEDLVNEAMVAASGYRAASLDAPMRPDEDATTWLEQLGADDTGLDAVEYREALGPLLASLPQREQRILNLRFYGNLTQTEIAEQLGISQMHVSRLLTRTLGRLRENLLRQD
jgi:RNA polymerase sigma-B factor